MASIYYFSIKDNLYIFCEMTGNISLLYIDRAVNIYNVNLLVEGRKKSGVDIIYILNFLRNI
jgi:hypothetical protein